MAYQVSGCISKYIKEPTYYQTNIKKQKDTIFPELTICPYTEACWETADKNRINRLKKSTEWKYLMCGLNGNLTGVWHPQFPCSFLNDTSHINCQPCIETLYPLGWETNYPEEWPPLKKDQFAPCRADSEGGNSSLGNDYKFLKCSEDDIKYGDLDSNFIVLKS